MKTLLLLIVCVLFLSCKPSKVEQLILDHEQTIDGVKTDFNMKIIELTKLRDFTASDSLLILEPYFEKKKADKIKNLRFSIESDSVRLIVAEMKIKDRDLADIYRDEVANIKNQIALTKSIINIFETDCKETFLESTYSSIQKFSANRDSVLYTIYSCEYSVLNPFLNNVKQTIKRTYYISPDESKIIGTQP